MVSGLPRFTSPVTPIRTRPVRPQNPLPPSMQQMPPQPRRPVTVKEGLEAYLAERERQGAMIRKIQEAMQSNQGR